MKQNKSQCFSPALPTKGIQRSLQLNKTVKIQEICDKEIKDTPQCHWIQWWLVEGGGGFLQLNKAPSVK